MAQAINTLPEKSCGKCVWWAPLAAKLVQVYRDAVTTELNSGICNNDQSRECGKMTDRTDRCPVYRKDW